MPSLAEIWNLSIGRIGSSDTIADPSARTPLGIACNRAWPTARDGTLESFNWPFASRVTSAALLDSVDVTPWALAYAWPQVPKSTCLAIRRLMRPGTSLVGSGALFPTSATLRPIEDQPEYAVMIVADADGLSRRVIATNESIERFVWTGSIDDPGLFSPLFVDAVAWRLAADLASTTAKSREIRQDCLRMFGAVLSDARAAAGRHGHLRTPDSELIAARS